MHLLAQRYIWCWTPNLVMCVDLWDLDSMLQDPGTVIATYAALKLTKFCLDQTMLDEQTWI